MKLHHIAIWTFRLEELKESCKKVREMFGIKLDVDWRYKGGVEDGNVEPVRTV